MKTRFIDEQIIQMIKEQEASGKAADVCRRYGISQGTSYKYKSKYGGIEPSDAKKLRALEAENAKLKKLLAEQILERALCVIVSSTMASAMLWDVNSKKVVTPDAKRKAAAHLVEVHQVSQRRACSALDVDRSTVQYESRRSDNTNLRDAMKAVAKERRRFKPDGLRQSHANAVMGWLGLGADLFGLSAQSLIQPQQQVRTKTAG